MLFRIGRVKVSDRVLESNISPSDLISAFARYIRGDWGGDCSKELLNDMAIVDGSRITAIYETQAGQRFCMTTENGRTGILLEDELAEVSISV